MLSEFFQNLKTPAQFDKLSALLSARYARGRTTRLFSSISEEINRMVNSIKPRVRILYGPSFSLYEPCRVHDFLLVQALRLRGAQISPCTIGRLQFGETSYIGGHWGGAKDEAEPSKEQDERNYQLVADADELLWVTWCGMKPIPLDRYVPPPKIVELKLKAKQYSTENYKAWTYQGLPVGKWALDTLRNNALVSDEKLVPDFKGKLYGYLHHIIVMVEACRAILEETKPDVVISNDSFYYPWAILEQLCGKRRIPHYNYWPGVRKNGVCYAKGEPAMNLNLSRTWQSFQERKLSNPERIILDNFLATRHTGNLLPDINTSNPRRNARELEPVDVSRLDREKPTALLAANVCWDLCALDKSVQFQDMFDWIAETVRFFAGHPEWQLIVKAHPAEENQHIPQTRQKLNDELRRRHSIPSENVFVLGPRTQVSVYELFPLIQVGLVFTTTVGLEMACLGIPVITAGRSHYRGMGFTVDPADIKAYFDEVVRILSTAEPMSRKGARQELAKQFFYLYAFEYPIDLGILEYSQGQAMTTVSSARDLAPGKHENLDLVCTKILNKKAFF